MTKKCTPEHEPLPPSLSSGMGKVFTTDLSLRHRLTDLSLLLMAEGLFFEGDHEGYVTEQKFRDLANKQQIDCTVFLLVAKMDASVSQTKKTCPEVRIFCPYGNTFQELVR